MHFCLQTQLVCFQHLTACAGEKKECRLGIWSTKEILPYAQDMRLINIWPMFSQLTFFCNKHYPHCSPTSKTHISNPPKQGELSEKTFIISSYLPTSTKSQLLVTASNDFLSERRHQWLFFFLIVMQYTKMGQLGCIQGLSTIANDSSNVWGLVKT